MATRNRMRRASFDPKGLMLIGHSATRDYYESKNGMAWAYFGTKKSDYKNKKYWEPLG